MTFMVTFEKLYFEYKNESYLSMLMISLSGIWHIILYTRSRAKASNSLNFITNLNSSILPMYIKKNIIDAHNSYLKQSLIRRKC